MENKGQFNSFKELDTKSILPGFAAFTWKSHIFAIQLLQ
jgi:hypothetical protein